MCLLSLCISVMIVNLIFTLGFSDHIWKAGWGYLPLLYEADEMFNTWEYMRMWLELLLVLFAGIPLQRTQWCTSVSVAEKLTPMRRRCFSTAKTAPRLNTVSPWWIVVIAAEQCVLGEQHMFHWGVVGDVNHHRSRPLKTMQDLDPQIFLGLIIWCQTLFQRHNIPPWCKLSSSESINMISAALKPVGTFLITTLLLSYPDVLDDGACVAL